MKLKTVLLVFFLSTCVGINAFRTTNSNNTISLSINDSFQNAYRTHTVAKGETVYSIANKYNTSEQDVFELNPNAKEGIKVGDVLRIPNKKRVPKKYSNHLIEAKETIYSVSRLYNITEQELTEANPDLDKNTFKIGKTIRIPKFDGADSTAESPKTTTYKDTDDNNLSQHIVKKKETLYGIAKSYNITIDDILAYNPKIQSEGLKENMTLQIPQKGIGYNANINNQNSSTSTKEDIVKIGILLPFSDDNSSVPSDKITEYYQGILLGVKEMKERGSNAEIYTLDVGKESDTKKLESILGTSEVNNLDLIIGGTSKSHISRLARFAKEKNIKYVVPFDARTSVANNPDLYRLTTSPSSLVSGISTAFADKFRNTNIIFISEPGSDNNKADIVAAFKKELTAEQIPFQTVSGSTSALDNLRKSLSSTQQNIIVPTSSSEATVKRIIALMQSIPNPNISLFGYPEWQTYVNYNNQFHKLDSYIYSIFYSNEDDQNVRNFTSEYKEWYNKNLINSYPKYAMLGYDTALYFMTALTKYGNNLDANAYQFKVPTLQSPIYFSRDNGSNGFVNSAFYFIHFDKDESSIEKIQYNK